MVNIRQTNISQAFLAESLSDKKDISEGIDINKTNASKECDICHYWYFLDKNCKFLDRIMNHIFGMVDMT